MQVKQSHSDKRGGLNGSMRHFHEVFLQERAKLILFASVS
jgi:hypothetical protein